MVLEGSVLHEEDMTEQLSSCEWRIKKQKRKCQPSAQFPPFKFYFYLGSQLTDGLCPSANGLWQCSHGHRSFQGILNPIKLKDFLLHSASANHCYAVVSEDNHHIQPKLVQAMGSVHLYLASQSKFGNLANNFQYITCTIGQVRLRNSPIKQSPLSEGYYLSPQQDSDPLQLAISLHMPFKSCSPAFPTLVSIKLAYEFSE